MYHSIVCVLLQLRHRKLTLPLQAVLSSRLAAMFEAAYGCDVVEFEPKWFAEFKQCLSITMRSFVKQSGPWDMCVAALRPLLAGAPPPSSCSTDTLFSRHLMCISSRLCCHSLACAALKPTAHTSYSRHTSPTSSSLVTGFPTAKACPSRKSYEP